MDNMKKRIIPLFVLFLLVSCQSKSASPSSNDIPENINEIADACNQPVDFGFFVESAVDSPGDIIISVEDGVSFTEMGSQGIQEITDI
ncbi:MAG: hypothetical protein K0B14_18590 [Anaerolineaceae bacterium]|nr:hypothetical protein [Anaerolineaceae bacterium]